MNGHEYLTTSHKQLATDYTGVSQTKILLAGCVCSGHSSWHGHKQLVNQTLVTK